MFTALKKIGFDIEFMSHAEAILRHDFTDAVKELESCLRNLQISANVLVGSGGGEASITQSLREAFRLAGWAKHNFNVEISVDGKPLVSQSHEVDHVKSFTAGSIAMEIEWNNKDPFFDRDLENFRRLHSQSAISVGVIVTRGKSLQANMIQILESFFVKENVVAEQDLERFGAKRRTARQSESLRRRVANTNEFRRALAEVFVADKYGQATTHWEKLIERIERGVGKPCPLLLIGIPSNCVSI